MVKLSVYGDVKSTCTQRILILLEELDLKYDLQKVDLKNGEHKEEEYMKMQPFGKIPVVKYGDKTLFESRAILRYIAKNNRYEDMDLLGDVYSDIWMEVESQNFCSPLTKILAEKVWKKMKNPEYKENNDVVKESLEEFEKILDVYDKVLENKKYIAGDSYTIADISHIPYAHGFLKCGYKNVLKQRPNVYKWLKRIMLRPAVKNVLEDNLSCYKKNSDNESESESESESEIE
jgi:glutathione S-transferase